METAGNLSPKYPKIQRGMLFRKIRCQKTLILMAVPGIVLVLLFNYLPLYGITLAFQKFSPAKGFFASDITWVGLKYFERFFNSPYVFRLLRNTVLLGVYGLVISFPLPVLLAILFDQLENQRFKKMAQTVSYMPYFLSTVVVVGIVKELFSYTGIVNDVIKALGGSAYSFLTADSWFRSLFIGSGIWHNIGWSSIIYLAALTNVDPQLFEAATIDGAGRFRRIWHISLPAIQPTIVIMLIFAIGNIMGSDYTKVLLLYNENTYEVADIIGTYVYREGILGGQYEYTTAIGLLMNLVGLALIVGANYISRKVSDSSLW